MKRSPMRSMRRERSSCDDRSHAYPGFAMNRPAAGIVDYALLASLGLMWGGSFMLIKVAILDVPPATMTVARLLVASAILFAVAVAYRERITFRIKTIGLILLVGLFGNALPFTLIAWGEQTVDASLASILMGIMPISTLFLAHFLTSDEILTSHKIIGGCIGLVGLVVLVGPAVLLRLGEDGIRQLAILAAAISYSINAILTKSLLNLPRRSAAAWLLFAGAVMTMPLALLFDNPTALQPDMESTLAVLLLGIFPTAIATLVMFQVLQRQGAAFFGQVNLIVPAFGVAWAAILLGERPELRAYLALAFILLGIWVARGVSFRPRSGVPADSTGNREAG